MATRRRQYQELISKLTKLERYYRSLTLDEQTIYDYSLELQDEYIANDNTSTPRMDNDLDFLLPRLRKVYNAHKENVVDPNIPTGGAGIKKRLVKGSKEAKAHMAYLRSLRK